MSSEIDFAWNGIRPILKEFSFANIKCIIGLARFDLTLISSVSQGDKEALLIQVEEELWKFNDSEKLRFLNIVTEEIINRNDSIQDKLEYYMLRLGWQIIDKKIIPIDLLSNDDLEELNYRCKTDLVKAVTRFRDGEFSGAIAAACGTVDAVVEDIYESNDLGNMGNTSFQERINKSLESNDTFSKIENQLIAIGWDKSDAAKFKQNLKGSVNQAANVMQSLRAKMSEVHGTKPALKALAFDSIKWCQILIRLLSI